MLKDSAASRVEIVEWLRGLAALAVAWFHFTHGSGLLADGWLKASGAYGGLGVEVFFVISGFIIPYSMHRGGFGFPRDVPAFLGKRLVRLEPPYLAAVLLAIALWYLSAALPGFRGTQPDVTVRQALLHLGYLNPYFGEAWLNPVFWSLAIEFQFYVLCVLIAPLLMHSSANVRLACVALFLVSGLLLSDPLFVFRYAPLFAAGIVAFLGYAGLASARSFIAGIAASGLAAWCMLDGATAVIAIATALAIRHVRAPRVHALGWLGAVSYSVYLVHVPIGGRIMNLGHRLPAETWMHVALLAAAMGITLAAAAVFHRAVERPAQRWSSQLAYRPRAVVCPVDEAAAEGSAAL